jgi:hypothetical protein
MSQDSVTHMQLKIAVFFDVTPCSRVYFYRCFKENCFLHHEHSSPTLMTNASLASEMSVQFIKIHGVTYQDTVIFRVTSVRNSNLTINKLYGRTYPASGH